MHKTDPENVGTKNAQVPFGNGLGEKGTANVTENLERVGKKKTGSKTDRRDIESQKERELSRGQAQSREQKASDRRREWELWCADPKGGEMVEPPISCLCHLDDRLFLRLCCYLSF